MDITKEQYDSVVQLIYDYKIQEYEKLSYEKGLFTTPGRKRFEGKRIKETNEYFMVVRDDYQSGKNRFREIKVIDADIIKTWEETKPYE